jgi:hypothetical protein
LDFTRLLSEPRLEVVAAAGAELEVVADRGGGGGDLAERSAVVSGSRVAVVAKLATLDIAHVALEHDTRRTMPGSRW